MKKRVAFTFLECLKEPAINWGLGLQKGVVASPSTFLTAALLCGEWLVSTLLPFLLSEFWWPFLKLKNFCEYFLRMSYLPLPWKHDTYCVEGLHPLGHSVTAAVIRDRIKWTYCVWNLSTDFWDWKWLNRFKTSLTGLYCCTGVENNKMFYLLANLC
jgi:hypothetical protein